MLNIILFGAPGCGKGTQAVRIKEKYNINHISTGEVIRGEISRGTELGKSMQEYIEAGKLAPDSIVIGMIRNYMAEHKDTAGNIFDGFPRTTAQAEEFDRILAESGESVNVMVYMDVPEEELVKRILLRGKDSGRADDASEDVIRNRISVYREQTAIVADHYSKQGKYVAVDGVGTMDEVFERICAAIDANR
ncbi:MAG: adenylate kinase [Alistipes sp.]|nr:adenylate kinase [Alistipes sp.]